MTYIADEYARVLKELKVSPQTYQDFVLMLEDSSELLWALDNPTVSLRQKHRVIDAVFDKAIAPFAKCLCDNNRISLYKDILLAYRTMLDEEAGVLYAELSAVVMPDKQELDKIKAMLAKKYNKEKVSLMLKEDKSLLGGFIVKVGDTEYDKSLKGAINNMKRKLELDRR